MAENDIREILQRLARIEQKVDDHLKFAGWLAAGISTVVSGVTFIIVRALLHAVGP